MSTHAGEQAKLDAWAAANPKPDPSPPERDAARETASSARDDASTLAEIFEQVTGGATFTEPQRETPSHEPVETDWEAPDLSEDGLEDAADSDLTIGGWI